MNKYIVLSLIAVAPLMLRAENFSVEELESLESLFESEDDALFSVEELTSLESLFESEDELLISVERPVEKETSPPLASIENVAQEGISYKQTDDPSNASSLSEPLECTPDIQPYQVSIGHIEGKGVGYDTGYTTLEAFFAPTRGKYIPFFDVKGHVFDNGKFATNLGVGLRYVWKPERYLFGASCYYDYRNTKHGHYNQIGAGLEVFADRYEFRANGYLPVGNKRFGYDKELTGITFKKFQGNNIFFNEFYDGKVEFAMKGFNAEIGVHPLDLPMPCYDLYVGAGTYYYVGHFGKNTWGGKLRVSGKVYKYFSVEISDSFDRVFHNRFQGQVSFTYPLGNKKLRLQKKSDATSCFNDNIMYWRGSQPVQRQDAIVVNHKKHHKTMVDPIAIDPATGEPYFVVFVNNTNPSAGDGTFENPFQGLAALSSGSSPGNSIYVFSGDTTTSYPSPTGFNLQPNQRFLGSGTTHTYQTTQGTLLIPPQTADIPHITYAFVAGAVGVTLSAFGGNEIAGFHISPDTPGIAAFNLNNNIRIFGSSTGGAIIRDNVLLNDFIGIRIGSGGQPVSGNCIIENNICSFHSNVPGGIGGYGIRADLIDGHSVISNNICNSNRNEGSGILVTAHAGPNPVRVDVLNNEANDNNNFGLQILFEEGPTPGTGSVCINAQNNVCSSNTSNGIIANSLIPETASVIPHFIAENNVCLLNGESFFVGPALFMGAETKLCARINNNTSTLTPPQEAAGVPDFSYDATGGSLFLEPPIGNHGTVEFSNIGSIVPAFPNDCICK